MNATSRLETVQPEQEQTPGSKNLGRKGKYVLRSDPIEGISSSVFVAPRTTVLTNSPQVRHISPVPVSRPAVKRGPYSIDRSLTQMPICESY